MKKKQIQSITNRLDFSKLETLPRVKIYTGDQKIEANCLGRYAIRKAQKALKFDAVLTVDQQPTVYFIEVDRKDLEAEMDWQKKLWNHGTANILVVIDPSEVRFYSAFAPPINEPIDTLDDLRLIETLSRDAFILNEFAIQVTTGVYYQKYRDRFDFNNTVDQCLLNNLVGTSSQLKDAGLKPIHAHTLIGCLLFLFYLWDRKIINADTFPKKIGFPPKVDLRDFLSGDTVSPKTASERLFTIFETIQGKFNGSLFGDNLKDAKQSIKTEHISILQKVISGKTNMKSGVTYLFRMYDFDIIPIETISAIYEGFLKGNDSTDKKDKGVFYTPRYLAELTIDVATERCETLLDKKYLDPACGSGIFLVILFNRMAEEWRSKKPNANIKTRLKAFRNFLTENLYGVDIYQTSTLITCFSLYLAFLDQMESKDIDELQKLLDEQQKNEKILPPLLNKTICSINFFKYESTEPFDLIIGNPPWTGRNQPVDNELKKWIKSDNCPFTNRFGQDIDSVFFPNKQTVVGFLWKSLCHLSEISRACFLIPTKTLLNKNENSFQKAWLSEVVIERIVQLSDFRFILFEHAKCPATIIRFNPNKNQIENNIIIHDAPKVSHEDPRQSYITIYKEDRKIIDQSELQLAANQNRIGQAWKQLLWGTERDSRFLDRLNQWSKRTIQNVIDKKEWIKGQGFQPLEPSTKKPCERKQPDSYRYIDAKNKLALNLVLLKSDTQPIGQKYKQLHRKRDERIFIAPLILINQGFTKFVYSDFPVLFQHSLQSIACKNVSPDKELLLFLCGVLNTPLSSYYTFHTASSLGTKRDFVKLFELLQFPFPQPEDFSNPQEKKEIVQSVAKCILDTKSELEQETEFLNSRNKKIDEAKTIIKKYVYEYYEIVAWEEKLINDTVNIFAKSATPHSLNSNILTLTPSTPTNRKEYADLFCLAINTWCRHAKVTLNAEIRIAENLGIALFILKQETEKKKYVENKINSNDFFDVLQMINESLQEEAGAYLLTQKRYLHFENDRAYMIKPLELRYWTQTAALNDAHDFFMLMFNVRYGDKNESTFK